MLLTSDKYCFKIIKAKFNKPFVITYKDQKDFENSIKILGFLKKNMKKVK